MWARLNRGPLPICLRTAPRSPLPGTLLGHHRDLARRLAACASAFASLASIRPQRASDAQKATPVAQRFYQRGRPKTPAPTTRRTNWSSQRPSCSANAHAAPPAGGGGLVMLLGVRARSASWRTAFEWRWCILDFRPEMAHRSIDHRQSFSFAMPRRKRVTHELSLTSKRCNIIGKPERRSTPPISEIGSNG
jgi:hypothetical protein